MIVNDIRKTLAYKICGYIFYFYVAAAFLYGLIWHKTGLFLLYIVMSGFVIIPFILLPILIILTIIGFITRNNYTNSSFSIFADIGYILTLLLFIIICIGVIFNL